MNDTGEFRRVAILGAGLVGASFGAAVARACRNASIAAYDTPEVLRKLHDRNCGWKTSEDLGKVVRDAELVYVALPVGAIIEMLPAIAAKCGARALVTDAGSTKAHICNAAKRSFGGKAAAGAKFLGGHPIAGKELSGTEHADAELFRGARYALIGNRSEEESDSRVQRFTKLLGAIGAEPVWTGAETHDRVLAIVSQMPQLVAIALARVIADETDETALPVSFAGNGLRDMLRIAGSRYETWRDICLTNTDNIARSLDRMAQAIDFLRTHLSSRELEAEFRGANEVYKSLRDMH